MILTCEERDTHTAATIAYWASPDHTPKPGRNGIIWTRTHPLRCTCGRVFFGYQPDDAPFEPYHNPEPRPGHAGRRLTCGNPLCAQAEDKERFRDSRAYGWEVSQPAEKGAA